MYSKKTLIRHWYLVKASYKSLIKDLNKKNQNALNMVNDTPGILGLLCEFLAKILYRSYHTCNIRLFSLVYS